MEFLEGEITVTLFRIKPEFQNDDSLYYHIDKVAVERKHGDMAYVYDISDGNYFWINKDKLEIV
jgi:hypothetical protein